MASNIFIKTERLILRNLIDSDRDGMFALDNNPEVHKYLGNKPIDSLQKAADIITHVRKQYEEQGIGRWALIEKKTDVFVGWAGLKYEWNPRENCHFYDLGYRLRKEFWGKGYATEAALASLEYGFNHLELEEIFAAAHVDNKASISIIKKLGFSYVYSFLWDDHIPCKWYRLKRLEWEASQSAET